MHSICCTTLFSIHAFLATDTRRSILSSRVRGGEGRAAYSIRVRHLALYILPIHKVRVGLVLIGNRVSLHNDISCTTFSCTAFSWAALYRTEVYCTAFPLQHFLYSISCTALYRTAVTWQYFLYCIVLYSITFTAFDCTAFLAQHLLHILLYSLFCTAFLVNIILYTCSIGHRHPEVFTAVWG